MQKLFDLFNIDRDELLEYKSIEQRLSGNFLNYEYEGESYYTHAHKFIVRQFYDLFKFVTDELEPVVVIKPETNLSYCSLVKNEIQLGTKVLYDIRFGQQFKVDVMFAIMIHEMFHKTITCTSLADMFYIKENYYGNQEIAKEIENKFKNKVYQTVMNILEDRRIERLGLKKYPGYVFYFDEKRKHAIEIHKEFISKIEEITDEASLIINFILYKILVPEIIDDYLEALDQYYLHHTENMFGRKKMDKIINDINDYIEQNPKLVYSDSIENIFLATDEILMLIPPKAKQQLKNQEEYSGINEPMNFDGGENIDECHVNSCKKISDLIKAEIEKQSEVYMDIKKSDYEVRIEKLDIPNADSGRYDTAMITTIDYKYIDDEILDEAQPHANKMKTNLAFLSSRLNKSTNNYELNEGEIDEDELYSIKYSNDIFYTEEEKPGFEIDFGILIDESGSMSSNDKIEEAKTVALACILAMEKENYINLFVYGHSNKRNQSGFMGVELYEYYNKKRKVNNWKNIFAAVAKGGNADGYAIQKVAEIMDKDSKNHNKILIVISDGLPSADNYGGEKAEAHVKSVVDKLESKGYEVVQICIDSISRSKYMFNNFIPFNNEFIKEFNDYLRKKISEISESF